MIEKKKVYGLILAAGRSKRMQAFKPLLQMGDCCVIKGVVKQYQKAGAKPIVVTGYRAAEIAKALEGTNTLLVENKQYETTKMFDSIRLGLQVLLEQDDMVDAVLISPGDLPLIEFSSIKKLIETFYKTKAKLILPTYQGRFGHPVLFSRELILSEEILYLGKKENLETSLRDIIAKYKEEALLLPLLDFGIRMDMDEPEDYQKILALYQARQGG